MNTKGVICYLVGNKDKQLSDFYVSLESLRDNYLTTFPCKVVAFHEKSLSESARDHIIAKSQIPIDFQQVEFRLLDGQIVGDTSDVGYWHMCNFFANDIFKMSVLDGFDYYCRLDTDSRILEPVDVGFFDWMESNNCQYSYIAILKNSQRYCTYLWATFSEFVKSNPQFQTLQSLSWPGD